MTIGTTLHELNQQIAIWGVTPELDVQRIRAGHVKTTQAKLKSELKDLVHQTVLLTGHASGHIYTAGPNDEPTWRAQPYDFELSRVELVGVEHQSLAHKKGCVDLFVRSAAMPQHHWGLCVRNIEVLEPVHLAASA